MHLSCKTISDRPTDRPTASLTDSLIDCPRCCHLRRAHGRRECPRRPLSIEMRLSIPLCSTLFHLTINPHLQSVSATIIMFAFLRLFYRSVKKRTDREKKKPGGRQPTKRTSLVEMAKSVSSELRRASEMADRASFKIKKSNPMTSFCFGLSTIEESYLLFTLVSRWTIPLPTHPPTPPPTRSRT